MGRSPNALTAGGVASQLQNGSEAFSAGDALLSWMQEIAPYGVFTTDRELRVQSWNHWLALHSKLSAETVIGRKLIEIYPQLTERRFEVYFQRALDGEISVLSSALHKYLLPFAAVGAAADEPEMRQTARVAPLPGAKGIVGTITTLEDVTEREHQAATLQRQNEHDRILSRSLESLLVSKDPLSDVGNLFPEVGPSLGLEAFYNHRYDPLSKTLDLQSATGISPKYRESITRLQLGERICGQVALNKKAVYLQQVATTTSDESESLRSLGLKYFCCIPLTVGDRIFGTVAFGSYSRDTLSFEETQLLVRIAQFLSVALDRAEREAELRSTQAILREYAGNLEEKVAERTARLSETIAQLESFSYTVAHDLRAPIRALKGYCEVLADDFSKDISVDGHTILDRLQKATTRLDALTRDLLKFSKIGRQSIELSSVSVSDLVKELMIVAPSLERAIVLREPTGAVHAHRTLFQQCLSNLLDNALKFRTPGIEPRIKVWSEVFERASQRDETTGTMLIPATINTNSPIELSKHGTDPAPPPRKWRRVWIEDNGIGIPPSLKEKVFGVFERAPGLDHVEGTGIGLAIVARAMQQMGGACGVESELGKGSRFWLELRSGD